MLCDDLWSTTTPSALTATQRGVSHSNSFSPGSTCMTNPDIDALVARGAYASKGAARRALGINEGPPLIADSAKSWVQKLIGGLAGSRPPKPPNA